MGETINVEIDDTRLQALLAAWMSGKNKTIADGLLTFARTICNAFMQYTIPRENMKVESMVRGEVHSVYRSQSQAYDAIHTNNPKAAKAFWSAVNGAKKVRQAEALLRKYGGIYAGLLFVPFDGGAAHRAARGADGKVKRGQGAVMVVRKTGKKDMLTRYVDNRVNNVGMAKAGWHEVWKDLGNVKGVPQWVARKRQGKGNFGSSERRFGGDVQGITLHNKVKHAQPAVDSLYGDQIMSTAKQRFSQFLLKQIQGAK